MPDIFRFYLRHCLIGFALAGVFVALILWANVGNLRHLILGASGGMLPLFLLWFFNGIVFAGVQFGCAVMLMAEPSDPPSGPKEPAPVRVPAMRTTGRAFALRLALSSRHWRLR
jgi:hypothetical protein